VACCLDDTVNDGVPADDLALIARHLSIGLGAMLDVGCGPGHVTAHLRSLEPRPPLAGLTGQDPVGPLRWCPGRSMSTYCTRVRSVVDVS
jgi:hypothetical protein